MVEGFLEITGITAPEIATLGETINFIVHTQNTGDADNFKIELTGDLTDSQEFSLGAGLIYDIPFSFTMPTNDVNITVNGYHFYEEPTGNVIFRQSYLPRESPDRYENDWIAIDTNNDGILEGWGDPSSIGSSLSPTHASLTLLCYDTEGREVLYRAISNEVYIYLGKTISYQYWKFDEPEPLAETSSAPTEPYTSNGQEVYT